MSKITDRVNKILEFSIVWFLHLISRRFTLLQRTNAKKEGLGNIIY
jgi:hypothetical protein